MDDRHEKEERKTKHYMYTVALNNRITSNAQEGEMNNRWGHRLVSLISIMEVDRRINLAWPLLMHTFLSTGD